MAIGLALLLLAYLLGSFPTAYLAGRLLRGIDIRSVGSGNPGMVNVYRQIGVAAALVVLAVDVAKGAGAVYLASWLASSEWPMYGTALAAVVGHNWSIFLRLRGGKGVATLLGVSLAVMPLFSGITAAFTLMILVVTRSVVVSFAAGIIFLNALIIGTQQSVPQIGLCLTLSVLVAATHFYRSGPTILPALREGRWRDAANVE